MDLDLGFSVFGHSRIRRYWSPAGHDCPFQSRTLFSALPRFDWMHYHPLILRLGASATTPGGKLIVCPVPRVPHSSVSAWNSLRDLGL